MIDKDFMTDTKIVGVSQFNDEGIPIQMILPDLKPGGRLFFIRDYGNQYDNNAIKAFSWNGKDSCHIGYISKELAAEIAPFLDKNMSHDLEGVIHEITGGTDGKNYGCNVRIWIQDPNEPSYEEIKAFQERLNRQPQGNYQQPPRPIYNTNLQGQNNAPSNPKTIGGLPTWLVSFCGVIIVLVLWFFISYIFFSDNDNNNSNTGISLNNSIDDNLITLDEYNKLEVGMSRTEVYDIVGSFGTKTSETGQIGDDYHIEMYEYEGYGELGANAQLMFVNGVLDTMSQYGLDYCFGATDKDNSSQSETETDSSSNAESSKYNTPENKASSVESTTSKTSSSVSSSVSTPSKSAEKNIPVKISDLDINIDILPPNIIDTVYMEATYTNNSSYTIKSFSLAVLLKDKNDKTYLSCYDTVLPGDTSPKFDAFGPDTQLQSDIEFLECRLRIVDENGDDIFIDYDYKLDTYDVLG